MRWLKHLTLAHSDPAIDAVCDKFGAEGYGVWWLILEDIAAPMEAGKMVPIQSHSVVKWASICRCSVRRFRSIVEILTDRRLIVTQTIGDRLQIEVYNILKYKDEYSKKSGDTPDLARARSEQIEIESRWKTDTKKNPPSDPPRNDLVKDGTWKNAREFMEAWRRHLKQRANQPEQVVAQTLIGKNGTVDWLRLVEIHPTYCSYWERRGWDFCPLTLLEWIDGGMLPPPPEAETESDRKRKRLLED